MFGRLVKRLARKHGYPGRPAPCRCRPAKHHRDCAYCGQGWDDGRVCGACKEQGIDGKVIPGTGRVVCAAHKETK
jgi:hypothetical protein